jgi:hypothetical protein
VDLFYSMLDRYLERDPFFCGVSLAMKLFISRFLIFIFAPGIVIANEWTPRPSFSVEGSTYLETLSFVSGISYGLHFSNYELQRKGLKNFYCDPNGELLKGSRIYDLLNERLTGDHKAEEVISALNSQLKTKYPCNG